MSRRKTPKAPLSPEERRVRNLAKHWQQRFAECTTDGDLARAAFDRARAAARRAQTTGEKDAMHALATALVTWAVQREEAEWRRHAS